MQINNKNLYESENVVSKYSANTTRVRSLNNPEKELIDRFDIKNKNVLVIGCGAGRVPANLLLYGNRVTGVDRSQKLYQAAVQNFPHEKFTDLHFILADATDLSVIENESFDTVIFPMNSIDYIDTLELRQQALQEASKKLRPGGLLVFSSHNKLAYLFSPKITFSDRTVGSLAGSYRFATESVTGGGMIFKGNPNYIITSTEDFLGYSFQGYICDTRNKIDKLFSKKLGIAQWVFPYLVYVFRKP